MTRTRSQTNIGEIMLAIEEWTPTKSTCADPDAFGSTVRTDLGWKTLQNSSITMNDEVVFRYYSRMRKGEIFNNPMTKVEVVENNPLVTVHKRHIHKYWNTSCNPDKWTYSGGILRRDYHAKDLKPFLPALSINSDDIDELKLDVGAKAWANLEVSELDIGVDFGEIRETYQLIANILKAVVLLYVSFKKKEFTLIKKQAKKVDFRDLWLQFRYGLRPLYSSARGALNAIVKERFKYRERFGATGEIGSSDNDETTLRWNFTELGQYSSSYDTVVQRKSTLNCFVSCGILAQVKDLQSFDRWGLGIEDVVGIAWDLIPYTFILDWFIGVGTWLASWSPEPGLSPLASWTTVVITRVQENSFGSSTPVSCSMPYVEHDNQLDVDCKGVWSKTQVEYYRIPGVVKPVLPRLKIRFDWKKGIDLISILSRLVSIRKNG